MHVSFHVLCRFTEGQLRQDQFEAGQANEYLHATADFLASSSGCTFHGQPVCPCRHLCNAMSYGVTCKASRISGSQVYCTVVCDHGTFRLALGVHVFFCVVQVESSFGGVAAHADQAAGDFQIGEPGAGPQAKSKEAEQFHSSSMGYQQQDGFHEEPLYGPDYTGYSIGEEDADQQKHPDQHEPILYLNSEIQEHRSRLAAIMPG